MAVRYAFYLGALLLAACAAPMQSPGSDPAAVGSPGSGAARELYLPQGTPVAAVVVLHGCGGVGAHDREWAQRLADWGYAALLIDSFRPRGYTEVCNRGGLVSPATQARDAFDGAAYLRARLGVREVGVIGFSHGGSAVVKAVLAGLVRRPDEPPFAAAVAYYPGCDPAGSLESDTLVLIGDADDWSSPQRCVAWRDSVAAAGHTLRLKVYPGALHAFDSPRGPHMYAGHHIGQEPAARADSIAEVQAFFAARLGR